MTALAVENKTQKIEKSRRWLQRLTQGALLFAIAGVIALVWSLFSNSGSVAGNTRILTPGTNSNISGTTVPAAADQTGTANQSGIGQAVTDQTATGKTATVAPAATGQAGYSDDEIPVYLVGAVSRPGIYIVKRGSYLYELVEKAGGLTNEAASQFVNLALKLTENQMLRIPTQSESTDQFSSYSFPTGANNAMGGSSGKSDTINLNTATQSELETLPGIGPATAAAIIADRTKNGPFKQIEDIMRVSGIKESRYAQLEPLIRVQ